MKRKVVAFVALLGLAMMLAGGSSARASGYVNHSGYYGFQQGTASFDQAQASFDSPLTCDDSLDNTVGYTRWAGVSNTGYGTLFQAGIYTETSASRPCATMFFELYGGGCSTIHFYEGVTLGDRIYAHVMVLDNTHYDVVVQDVTAGIYHHLGSTFCTYAYEYKGSVVEFADERLGPGGSPFVCDYITNHISNDILSPQAHYVGGGSSYPYLSTLQPSANYGIDDDSDGPQGNATMQPGSLGSNSNFLETFYWRGDQDNC